MTGSKFENNIRTWVGLKVSNPIICFFFFFIERPLLFPFRRRTGLVLHPVLFPRTLSPVLGDGITRGGFSLAISHVSYRPLLLLLIVFSFPADSRTGVRLLARRRCSSQGRLLSGPGEITSVRLGDSRSCEPRASRRSRRGIDTPRCVRSPIYRFLRRGGARRARIQGVPGVLPIRRSWFLSARGGRW